MKKVLLFSLALCLVYEVYCQSPKNCKFDIDIVDDFTKKRKVFTEFSKIFSEGGGGHFAQVLTGIDMNKERIDFFICAGNDAGNNILKILWQSTSSGANTNGDTYLFLLSNGEVITTKIIDQGSAGNQSGYGSSGATFARFTLGVDSLGWVKFRNFGIKKFRVPRDQYNYWDLEIKEKNAEILKNNISCIESLNIRSTYVDINDKKKDVRMNTTTAASIQDVNKMLPALLKKWHMKAQIIKDGKTIEYDLIKEFLEIKYLLL